MDWSFGGNARVAVIALFHKCYRRRELRGDFAYPDRCRSSGLLYSRSPRHQGGPDGRIAIRVDLMHSSSKTYYLWPLGRKACLATTANVTDNPRFASTSGH